MALISGYHHITMSVDGVQDDYDFFTRTLGMKSVKRTVLVDTSSAQGSWTLAGGTIHHLAFNTLNEENQYKLKAIIEGMGFTDVSEQKDRNYFKSCNVRSPGGALFEIAWSVAAGCTVDEPAGMTGRSPVFPPWFADRKAEMVAGLEECNW